MPWVAIAAAGAAVIGGVIASSASASDREAALAANKAAVQKWLDVHVPDPAEQKIALQHLVQTGQMTPALETAFKQDPSAMNAIQTDPRLRESQMRSLSSLEDLGRTGFNLQDKAGLQQAMTNIATDDKGRRDAISNSFAARGLGGSGLDLASQMGGAQASGNRTAQAQLDTEAQRRNRSLQAIMGGGQLAGNLRQQDFGEQSSKAQATDAINRFNTQNMQSVQQRNIASQNNAQQRNLGEQQRISDTNIGLSNQQDIYNKGLSQQQFDNQARVASGQANAELGQANAYNQSADRTAGIWAGVGTGVAKGLTAYGQQANQDDEYSYDQYGNKRKG